MDPFNAMAEDFKLLGDKTRLNILALLKSNEMCVCDIVEQLNISQSGTSQHLRKLKAAGMVTETRRGQWVYYSLQTEGKEYIQEALKHLPHIPDQTKVSVSC